MRYPIDTYYYPNPITPEPRTLTVAELRQQVIDGIFAKDADAVAASLDAMTGLGHKMKPDAVMLYAAASLKDAATCRVLIARGAAWTPQQYHYLSGEGNIFDIALTPEILHELRRFNKPTQHEADAHMRYQFVHDLKSFAVQSSSTDASLLATYCDLHQGRAIHHAMEGNMADLRAMSGCMPNGALDMRDLIKNVLSGESAQQQLDVIAFLQEKRIPLRKLRLDENDRPHEWMSWIEPLHRMGLLDPHQSNFRLKALAQYGGHCYMKSKGLACREIKEWKQPLQILCSRYYPVTLAEAEDFMNINGVRKEKSESFLKRVCNFGYFTAPAFSNVNLKGLLPFFGAKELKQQFNYQSLLRSKNIYAAIENPSDINKSFAKSNLEELRAFEEKHGVQHKDVPAPGVYKKALDA